MPVIAIQGINEGAGATSVSAGLGYALFQLGVSVLLIDLSPTNMLRLHFNTPYKHHDGWARSVVDDESWEKAALRYTDGLDYLPFGSINEKELALLHNHLHDTPKFWEKNLAHIQTTRRYNWIVINTPASDKILAGQGLKSAANIFIILNPQTSCHVRLQQQKLPDNCRLLLNKFYPLSELQRDLHKLWHETKQNFMQPLIHYDEAIAESFAMKQPVGEYRPSSLANEEFITLANWCMVNIRDTQK